jgi:NarL family two-component system response regulator LiaR
MTHTNGCAKRKNMAIKVFIFEDHWMCREALVSLLSKETWAEIVGAAEDVRKNLDNAVHVRPDVVLMDILFQGQKLGIEATREIKKKLPDTKVIMFTEFPDEETLRDAVNAGASGYLLKRDVHDPDILYQAIRSVHLGEAYMTPSMTSKILAMVKKLSDEPKYELTRRELEILKLVAEGKENREIGSALNIDIRTVANHVSNLLFKMNARNRTEAAALARREGLVN